MKYYKEILSEDKINDFFTYKAFEDAIAMCSNPIIIVHRNTLKDMIYELSKNIHRPYPFRMSNSGKYDFYGENIDVYIIDRENGESIKAMFDKVIVLDDTKDDMKRYTTFLLT